jgi:hypothetical protein
VHPKKTGDVRIDENEKKNNPGETPAAAAASLTPKKQSSCQFWFCWAPQRWRSGLPLFISHELKTKFTTTNSKNTSVSHDVP